MVSTKKILMQKEKDIKKEYSQILRVICHDLGNSLSVILNASVMAREFCEEAANVSKYFNVILNAANEQAELITKMKSLRELYWSSGGEEKTIVNLMELINNSRKG
ncbi:MAG: hypothetical protein HQK54_01330, partial [Oligoflexales bacterium]|nr:hypothetical protein [Oligoflexales bacterium]